MRTQFSKFALAAILWIALAFTLSACPERHNGGTETCGGKEYDTTEYSCDGGELVGKCRGVDYYPDYQTCRNGKIEEKNPAVSSSSDKAGSSSSSSSEKAGSSSSSDKAVSSSSSSSSSKAVSSSSSAKAGGISFNENSQVYIMYKEKISDGFYQLHIGEEAFKGSGVIEVTDYKNNNLRAGSVTNGIVSLNLPANVPSEYLQNWTTNDDDDEMQSICSNYTKGIKIFPGLLFDNMIRLTDGNGGELGELMISSEGTDIGIYYVYFSKAGKITCSAEEDSSSLLIDINAKEGWNRIYESLDLDLGQIKMTTDNILTKEAKWGISLPSTSSFKAKPSVQNFLFKNKKSGGSK